MGVVWTGVVGGRVGGGIGATFFRSGRGVTISVAVGVVAGGGGVGV